MRHKLTVQAPSRNSNPIIAVQQPNLILDCPRQKLGRQVVRRRLVELDHVGDRGGALGGRWGFGFDFGRFGIEDVDQQVSIFDAHHLLRPVGV